MNILGFSNMNSSQGGPLMISTQGYSGAANKQMIYVSSASEQQLSAHRANSSQIVQ
jgi:hypothetical protein